MPFTLAHPAAAIPLSGILGRASVLSALIVGSMAPDLIYFVPMGVDRAASHSLAGLLWFCVPVGFVGYVVFHALLRPLVSFLLPMPLRDRLPPIPGASCLPVSPIWAVLVSLGVGAATHLLWDACTHEDGFIVAEVPALRAFLWEVSGYRFYTYKLLQHGSTLIGLSLLAVWGWQWFLATSVHHHPRRWQPSEAVRLTVLLVLLAAPALGGLSSGLWHMGDAGGLLALQRFAGHAVITAMRIGGTILLSLGVVWRLWEAWGVSWPSRRVEPPSQSSAAHPER
jgi:Domain of unknown function (DUF4184)